MIPRAFFARSALEVAPDLLGRVIERGPVRLVITEVEAYRQDDSACHAFRGRTKRNAPLWGPPGVAYVYLCYGLHHMLNFVCEPEGAAAAVLVRGAVVESGHEIVRERRHGRLECIGPGKVAQALGLDVRFSGTPLDRDLLVLPGVAPRGIEATPRIGIDFAAPEDRGLLWRFVATG